MGGSKAVLLLRRFLFSLVLFPLCDCLTYHPSWPKGFLAAGWLGRQAFGDWIPTYSGLSNRPIAYGSVRFDSMF